MEASDDDKEYDEDYGDKGRLDNDLLRKIGMLHQKCVEYKRIIKKAEDGYEIFKISCKANKMSDKDQL